MGKRNSKFQFRFPFSYHIENGTRTFIFVFRFSATLDNRFLTRNKRVGSAKEISPFRRDPFLDET